MATRFLSLKLGERIISVLPGDKVRLHHNNKIELLPGYTFSGMTIAHDGHDYVLAFDQFARIKTSLEYVRE